MSRDAYRGPKLPRSLLDQVQDGNVQKRGGRDESRKAKRKAEREQKKAARVGGRPGLRDGRRGNSGHQRDDEVQREREIAVVPRSETKKAAMPLKSILKKPPPIPESESGSEHSESPPAPTVSKVVKSKLLDDDAEIAALEKKLGVKGKKSKALELDGLDWIAEGSESDDDDGGRDGSKRKRVGDDEWLRSKRARAGGASDRARSTTDKVEIEDTSSSAFDDEEDGIAGIERDDLSIDGDDEDAFEDFGSDPDELSEADCTSPPQKKQRENPYIAPTSNNSISTAKYVPPSLRKPASSEEEALSQLRRQLQGLLNRLSEANLLSIIQSLEELYTKNARGHVTSILIDLLVGLISDAAVLNDAFLILHAGFAAGVYKVVGTDFGAQLLERLVEAFDHHRQRTAVEGKHTLNLLAYLSCLYTLQVVGSALIFDYIRLLLEELSEANTELLLRVIRTSGQQLRQDDPTALKDIVLLLQRSVASTDEQNLSVRTKFMIETINDLKNNRMKGGAAASAVAAEQTTRMKKTLGSLSTSRSLKATEPLRIGLSDIRDTEKKGKWWLVGASYMDPAKHVPNSGSSSVQAKRLQDEDAGYESETPGSVNLNKLARAQGMNTDVRRAIFVTILSSSDPDEAHERLLRLHLKSKQMLEVPRVVVHCAGAEATFNPFYALLAGRVCGERGLRKGFEFAVWDFCREMDGEDEDEDEHGGKGKVGMRKLVNIAKFTGTLIANGALDLRVLKQLDFGFLGPDKRMFVEVLLSTLFVRLWKKGGRDFEKAVKNIFSRAAGVAGLPQGLMLFLDNVLSQTELATGKDKKTVDKGCAIAIEALTEAARDGAVVAEEEGSD